MDKAVIRATVEIPRELVNIRALKKALTFNYAPMGEDPLEVTAYRLTKTALCVPRQYGIDYCEKHGIPYVGETAEGFEIDFPKIPEPRDYQVDTLDEIEQAAAENFDFMFRARTGWGKTIGVLIVAARLRRTTLILVDQENLKEQWFNVLTDPNLFGFSPGDIGIIQGPKCDYQKPVVIAMVQTLSQKRFPPEVYNYFGLVIVDEVHIIGAPTFSKVLLSLPATYRIGVSATPKRKDGLQKLLSYSLGDVKVYVEDEHDPSAVYVMESDSVYSEYANRATKAGRFINEVVEDGARNLKLAEAITYLYDTGRDVLVLSDRTEQLKNLESLCYYLGVPTEDMGMYTGYQLEYGYEKDPTPKTKIKGANGVEYTPVVLNLISKKSRKDVLELIKTTARIIFATYGKFSKGVDEPRLSAGVDASPRSTSEQIQGRILRKLDDKYTPIWITACDTNSYRSMFALAQRLKDYETNNSMVSKWSLESGKTPCDIRELRIETLEAVSRLKSLQIGTDSDGLNMLLTREQQIRQKLPRGIVTTKGHARRPDLRQGSLPLA